MTPISPTVNSILASPEAQRQAEIARAAELRRKDRLRRNAAARTEEEDGTTVDGVHEINAADNDFRNVHVERLARHVPHDRRSEDRQPLDVTG
ncbi:MAG: hypothetical protein ACFCVE_01880 [Phycisphaerae bacterium]